VLFHRILSIEFTNKWQVRVKDQREVARLHFF
jgi:hypothetical protein